MCLIPREHLHSGKQISELTRPLRTGTVVLVIFLPKRAKTVKKSNTTVGLCAIVYGTVGLGDTQQIGKQ